MNRLLRLVLWVAGFSAIALVILLAWSTTNASFFEEYYPVLLSLNAVVALTLFIWVLALSWKLTGQRTRGEFGARLTLRFVRAFAIVAVIPGILVYLISVQFLSKSIESWFNVRVDTALDAGIKLAQAAIDAQLGDMNTKARTMSLELVSISNSSLSTELTRLREQVGIQEAMIFTLNGRVLSFSADQVDTLFSEPPPQPVLSQLRLTHSYAQAESRSDSSDITPTLGGDELTLLRVIVPVSIDVSLTGDANWSLEPKFLQLVQAVPPQIANSIRQVQLGYSDYQELRLSRSGLTKLYSMTLTLAMLLSMFAAVAAAFYLSRRLVSPLLQLAEGTKAVAVGDYRKIPEPVIHDEMWLLTHSFNSMTTQLNEARRLVEVNRQQLEKTNAYLENILSNLSAGVLVFDEQFRLSLVNIGAEKILHSDLKSLKGRPLHAQPAMLEFAKTLEAAFAEYMASNSQKGFWQQQLEFILSTDDEGNTCLLSPDHTPSSTDHPISMLVRGSSLNTVSGLAGYVVVFDDISDVISANRAVAWAEVARRLAHEIKNPLTPIQLSAERLAIKLTSKLDDTDAAMLSRSTQTIINQVAALIRMVDDFRDYAKVPSPVLSSINLNDLIEDVLALYGWDPESGCLHHANKVIKLQLDLSPDLPHLYGDLNQLRQVIHNLIGNAQDALDDVSSKEMIQNDENVSKFNYNEIGVSTSVIKWVSNSTEHLALKLVITDSGSGFSPRVLSRAFEPYVTTKSKGTGLGLAIVKKIIDEHGGKIELSNRPQGGAMVSLMFMRLISQQ